MWVHVRYIVTPQMLMFKSQTGEIIQWETKIVCQIWHEISYIQILSMIYSILTVKIVKQSLDPINRSNPATFLCLSQARTQISSHGFFHVQWAEMRGDCLLCWYWWNCWWSLFKLSFIIKLKNLKWYCVIIFYNCKSLYDVWLGSSNSFSGL